MLSTSQDRTLAYLIAGPWPELLVASLPLSLPIQLYVLCPIIGLGLLKDWDLELHCALA